MYVWFKHRHSSRIVLGIGLLQFIRGLLLKVMTFPFRPGHYWEEPPLPSLTVVYGKSSDHFYSGHVGSAVISFFFWKDAGYTKMTFFCVFLAAYMAFVVFSF